MICSYLLKWIKKEGRKERKTKCCKSQLQIAETDKERERDKDKEIERGKRIQIFGKHDMEVVGFSVVML